MVVNDVFNGDASLSNEHFKGVGLALGLVRIKDIHAGKITDLKQAIEESKPDENTSKS